MAQKKFWLVKTEAESFSIEDLAKEPKQTTCWSGVRNYQARNFMREMKVAERVLFYHSGGEEPAIVGVASVAREAYPDHTAWDKKDHHFDAASTEENPRWDMVDLKLERVFKKPLALAQLRGVAALKEMELLRKGSRLSVQPVREAEFESIMKMANGSEAGASR